MSLKVKELQDKEWLINELKTKKVSKIAKSIGCYRTVIYSYIRKYKIVFDGKLLVTPNNKRLINNLEFINKVKEKVKTQSYSQIAKDLNCKKSMIAKICQKYKLETKGSIKFKQYNDGSIKSKSKLFKCLFCKEEKYIDKAYFSSVKRGMYRFCSNKCQALYYGLTKRFGRNPKEKIIKNIEQYIKKQNKYIPVFEIYKKLHISYKLIKKFDISIPDINANCGFFNKRKYFENFTRAILKKLYKDLKWQKTFDDCLSPFGNHLMYDFYSKDKNILIECDGDHHINENHLFYSEYNVYCDRIKDDYAKTKGIKLVRIPYFRPLTKEYILNHFN